MIDEKELAAMTETQLINTLRATITDVPKAQALIRRHTNGAQYAQDQTKDLDKTSMILVAIELTRQALIDNMTPSVTLAIMKAEEAVQLVERTFGDEVDVEGALSEVHSKAEVKRVVDNAVPVTTKKQTKRDVARAILLENKGKPTRELVALIVENMDVGVQYARTMVYSLSKES